MSETINIKMGQKGGKTAETMRCMKVTPEEYYQYVQNLRKAVENTR